jgi:hypothetical protein
MRLFFTAVFCALAITAPSVACAEDATGLPVATLPSASPTVAPTSSAPQPAEQPSASPSPSASAGCSNVLLSPGGTNVALRVCAQDPTQVSTQNNVFAVGGPPQTFTIYSDALSSFSSIADDQGNPYRVAPTGTPSISWTPKTFFSRLDFSNATSKISLFAFAFGGLSPHIVSVNKPDSSSGAFAGAVLRFAFLQPGLPSIQLQPSLTDLSLNSATPVGLTSGGPSSQAFLGFSVDSLLSTTLNLNGSSIAATAQLSLPAAFGGGKTTANLAVDPHDLTFSLPNLSVPNFFGFSAALSNPRISLTEQALELRADAATLTLPKGISGALTASKPVMHLAADPNNAVKPQLEPSATAVQVSSDGLHLGSVATINSVTVDLSTFSEANPYVKITGKVQFNDALDGGLMANISDLELNGSEIKTLDASFVNAKDLAQFSHLFYFTASLSEVDLSYDPTTGVELTFRGQFTTPPWLGGAGLQFANLKYKTSPPGLDGTPLLTPTAPLKIASLTVTLAGDSTKKCGTTGVALVRDAVNGNKIYLCGNIAWPQALQVMGQGKDPIAFSDIGFGPDGVRVGSLSYTKPVSFAFPPKAPYLSITTNNITLDASNSSLDVTGTGSFDVPIFHGKLLKTNDFTFTSTIARDYDFEIQESSTFFNGTWGPVNVQAANATLKFSEDSTGVQQQDVSFDALGTWNGLGVQGKQIGFTVTETPPPDSSYKITEHGQVSPYIDYSKVAYAVVGLLIGLLVSHH